MSRQSVLAVPSCCRVTQLSNVILYGQTRPCWVTVIGLLPVPRRCPSFDLVACSTSFAPATVGRDARAWSSGATPGHQTPRPTYWYLGHVPVAQGPCLEPAPVPRSVGPSLIDAPLPPYQSSLLKVCRPSNKTVRHMRHCFCIHSSSTFCKIQTKTTSTSSPHGHLQ